MAMSFEGKVAIVTGAGGGLGRAHALELARRGARVVVSDLGGAVDGSGGSSKAAQDVVREIEALGGKAIANGGSVSDREGAQSIVRDAVRRSARSTSSSTTRGSCATSRSARCRSTTSSWY